MSIIVLNKAKFEKKTVKSNKQDFMALSKTNCFK